MAWKKPFFKRVSSKISGRMLTLMTLPTRAGEGAIWPRIYRVVYYSGSQLCMLRIGEAHTRYPLSVKDLTVNGQRITVFAPLCLVSVVHPNIILYYSRFTPDSKFPVPAILENLICGCPFLLFQLVPRCSFSVPPDYTEA
jgi:hypothetical protein